MRRWFPTEDRHPRLRHTILRYSVEFESRIGDKGELSGKLDPVQLQSLTGSCSAKHEFRKYLVAGYNACAISKQQYGEFGRRFQALDGIARQIDTLAGTRLWARVEAEACRSGGPVRRTNGGVGFMMKAVPPSSFAWRWLFCVCLVLLCAPTIAAQKRCPDGLHYEIDLRELAIEYQATAFSATLSSLSILRTGWAWSPRQSRRRKPERRCGTNTSRA